VANWVIRSLSGGPLHVSRRIGHDLMQGFGLVLVEAGTLEPIHVLADQGQLIGEYLKRILAHAGSALAAS